MLEYVGLSIVPVLTELRERMDVLRANELETALRRLRHLPERDRSVVEEFSKRLMNKFLHAPMAGLRTAAVNGREAAIADAVRFLFGFELPMDSETAQSNAVANVNVPRDT